MGKNMTMIDLQKVLGARVMVTLDNSLSQEERQTENEQSKLIMNIGKQMINNANLMLNYERLLAQTKGLEKSVMPSIIGGIDD